MRWMYPKIFRSIIIIDLSYLLLVFSRHRLSGFPPIEALLRIILLLRYRCFLRPQVNQRFLKFQKLSLQVLGLWILLLFERGGISQVVPVVIRKLVYRKLSGVVWKYSTMVGNGRFNLVGLLQGRIRPDVIWRLHFLWKQYHFSWELRKITKPLSWTFITIISGVWFLNLDWVRHHYRRNLFLLKLFRFKLLKLPELLICWRPIWGPICDLCTINYTAGWFWYDDTFFHLLLLEHVKVLHHGHSSQVRWHNYVKVVFIFHRLIAVLLSVLRLGWDRTDTTCGATYSWNWVLESMGT